jgi:hypothetical protein
MLYGKNQDLGFGLAVTEGEAQSFAATLPMAYALLPSRGYFTSVHEQVTLLPDDAHFAPWRAIYGNLIGNWDELHSFLTSASDRTMLANLSVVSGIPPQLNHTAHMRALATHNIADAWTPPSGIPLTQIAGWGIPKTVKGITFDAKTTQYCGATDDVCHDTTPWQLIPGYDTTMDGDGTVVTPSALWTSASAGAVNYWVNLDDFNIDLLGIPVRHREHGNILEVPQLTNFITDLLTQSIKPIADYTYLSTVVPTDTSPRLRFTLHSPLSLHLYDDLGNHTGFSTSTGFLEENIPGSRYKTYGELKYIEAPASTTLRLVLNGYASGSFTLDVEKKLGEATIASTTFAAIPSSTSTVATITVPQGVSIEDMSTLVVDVDGNGTTDIALTPTLGDIVLPDFAPPQTTASATGTLGTNGWHASNVVVTLSATDTGSGVQSTFYSQSSGTTWSTYTVPFIISNEGSTTLLYYSLDNAGNREATSTLIVNIDKIAPKASVSVDPITKDLKIEGSDITGSTTVTKSVDTYTITDVAGHTTKLFFQKTFTGNRLTYAKLTKVQYDNGAIIILPSSYFVYLWQASAPQTLLTQTIAVNDTYVITAVYDKAKNKTTVLLKKKGAVIQTQQFTGLHIVKLTVDNGLVGYVL